MADSAPPLDVEAGSPYGVGVRAAVHAGLEAYEVPAPHRVGKSPGRQAGREPISGHETVAQGSQQQRMHTGSIEPAVNKERIDRRESCG